MRISLFGTFRLIRHYQRTLAPYKQSVFIKLLFQHSTNSYVLSEFPLLSRLGFFHPYVVAYELLVTPSIFKRIHALHYCNTGRKYCSPSPVIKYTKYTVKHYMFSVLSYTCLLIMYPDYIFIQCTLLSIGCPPASYSLEHYVIVDEDSSIRGFPADLELLQHLAQCSWRIYIAFISAYAMFNCSFRLSTAFTLRLISSLRCSR